MIFLPWDLLLIILFVAAVVYETHQKVRYYVRFSLFFGIVSLAAVILIPVALFRPGDVHNTVLVAYVLGPLLNFILGTKIHLRGEENFVEDGSVIVANHQSSLDFQGMITIWPRMARCAAIAKNELFYSGPFGLVAWLCGTIFIERSDPKSSHASMNKAGDIVKNKKLKLWIFPEGTRSSAEEMLPFKKGAFHLAITAQLPISPVVFSRYHFLNHSEKRYDPGHVIITVLPPIPTQNLTLDDMPQLIDDVRAKMMQVYRSTSDELKGK